MHLRRITPRPAVAIAVLSLAALALAASPAPAADYSSLALLPCPKLAPATCGNAAPGAPPRFEQATICKLRDLPDRNQVLVLVTACLLTDPAETGLPLQWDARIGILARDAARDGYRLAGIAGQSGAGTHAAAGRSVEVRAEQPLAAADAASLVDRAVAQLHWRRAPLSAGQPAPASSGWTTDAFLVPLRSPP